MGLISERIDRLQDKVYELGYSKKDEERKERLNALIDNYDELGDWVLSNV